MGELLVICGDDPLKTLLGSCIGLALYSRRGTVGGLAHIVLPESRGRAGPPGKFADTAIPEMIRLIEVNGGNVRNVNAKIAGGANMLDLNAATTIGDQNQETIRRILSEMRIPIIAEHCGGVQGRRMTFYPSTGRLAIDVVGGETIEI